MPSMDTRIMITLDIEADGRWMAEVSGAPGALAYGSSAEDAVKTAAALALRALADRIEHGETLPAELATVFGPDPTT